MDAEVVVPCEGFLRVEGGHAWASPYVLVNEAGEERPARIYDYRVQGVAPETWQGVVAFESDEPAMNLARNCLALRAPLPIGLATRGAGLGLANLTPPAPPLP